MSSTLGKKWEELDADHGGRLTKRARQIREAHKIITIAESQIAVLAELDYDTWAMVSILDRAHHTIELQRSSIRKKMNAPRSVALGLLFTDVGKKE